MNSIDNMVNEYLNETGNGEQRQARGSSNRKYKSRLGNNRKNSKRNGKKDDTITSETEKVMVIIDNKNTQ